jgi:hypothetical protein
VSLPLDDELKAYLRVTTDVEKDLISQINVSARAWLRGYYNVPLNARERVFRTRWPRLGAQREPDTRLVVPVRPCAGSGVVQDASGATVDAATYIIDERTGYIEAKRFQYFSHPPYDITINVGWDLHPDYFEDVEPILRQAVLWAATDYYRRRNSGAVFEQSGGQVSITYTEEDIPPALRSLMAGLRDQAWFA